MFCGFDLTFYKHCLRRYKSLAILPLTIYLGFIFLDWMLNGDLSLIMPPVYAAVIIPLASLVVFAPWFKKTESTQLVSLPYSRGHIFASMALAVATLTLLPLLIMVIGSMLVLDTMNNEVRYAVAMMLLMAFYLCIAFLGIALSGNVVMALLTMGLLAFGPVLLYWLLQVNLEYLLPFSHSSNADVMYLLCPIGSAANFFDNGQWPCWPFHILMALAALVAAFKVIAIRPLEKHGETMLFPAVFTFLFYPALFLVVTYLLAPLLLMSHFADYYNAEFYWKAAGIILAAALVTLVLMEIWLQKKKSLLRFVLYLCLAEFLVFAGVAWGSHRNIPLEKAEESEWSFVAFDRYFASDAIPVDETREAMDYLRSHPEKIRKDDEDCYLALSLYPDGEFYSFYVDENFLLEDSPVAALTKDVFLNYRQDLLEDEIGDYYLDDSGKVYDGADLKKNIQKYYSDDFTSLAAVQETGDALSELYPYALSSLDFSTWEKAVYKDLKPCFDIKTIQPVLENLDAYPDLTFAGAERSDLTITEVGDIEEVLDVSSDHCRVGLTLDLLAHEDVYVGDLGIYAGDAYPAYCLADFQLRDGTWQVAVQIVR